AAVAVFGQARQRSRRECGRCLVAPQATRPGEEETVDGQEPDLARTGLVDLGEIVRRRVRIRPFAGLSSALREAAGIEAGRSRSGDDDLRFWSPARRPADRP